MMINFSVWLVKISLSAHTSQKVLIFTVVFCFFAWKDKGLATRPGYNNHSKIGILLCIASLRVLLLALLMHMLLYQPPCFCVYYVKAAHCPLSG